jgi:hypothetical protein
VSKELLDAVASLIIQYLVQIGDIAKSDFHPERSDLIEYLHEIREKRPVLVSEGTLDQAVEDEKRARSRVIGRERKSGRLVEMKRDNDSRIYLIAVGQGCVEIRADIW